MKNFKAFAALFIAVAIISTGQYILKNKSKEAREREKSKENVQKILNINIEETTKKPQKDASEIDKIIDEIINEEKIKKDVEKQLKPKK